MKMISGNKKGSAIMSLRRVVAVSALAGLLPAVAVAGPTIEFAASVPSAGTYRLYLDFLHDGVVRTAEFTATASTDAPAAAAPDSSTTTPTSASHDDSDGHHSNGAGR